MPKGHFANDHLPPVADESGGLSAAQFERLEHLLLPGYYASKIMLAMYESRGFGVDTNGNVTFPEEPAPVYEPEPLVDGGQSGDENKPPPIRGDEGG
jgi:hypothetical protein